MDIAWPSTMVPALMVWGVQKAGALFRAPYGGRAEVVTFPGWFWHCSVTLRPRRVSNGSEIEAFLEALAGGDNRVLVPHWMRPAPRGTMRGTPALSANAARGAQQVAIGTSGTLLAGDLFAVGGSLYRAAFDAAPVSGVLTVTVTARVRAALSSGAAVTWDAPTVPMIAPSLRSAASWRPAILDGAALDLEEAP